MQLREHQDSGEGRCAECQVRPSVGPCGACQAMICGDCCTMVTDPGGKRVICISCARMVADIDRAPLRRRSPNSRITAWMILAVLALGLLAVFFRP